MKNEIRKRLEIIDGEIETHTVLFFNKCDEMIKNVISYIRLYNVQFSEVLLEYCIYNKNFYGTKIKSKKIGDNDYYINFTADNYCLLVYFYVYRNSKMNWDFSYREIFITSTTGELLEELV